MQKEGKPRFLKHHTNSVRGVAFSPRDRYLFCSGAYDGKVNLYSSLNMVLMKSYSVTKKKNINAVRFTSDGSKVLACITSATSGKLSVVDVERGEQILAYRYSVGIGRDRTGLATDPTGPNTAVSVAVNGKGLAIFDLRMSRTSGFVMDLHSSTIRDIVFLESSWPWAASSSDLSTIVTAGSDGCCKVCLLDGRVLHTFNSGNCMNTVCPTPEPFQGKIISGGDKITSYIPDLGIQESLCENRGKPIWKVRYTSNGSFLYSVCEGGVVRKYRRYPDRHEYLGEVYTHNGDIQDLDISLYDDYLITASKDRTVGILRLGAPSHGWTDYFDLT